MIIAVTAATGQLGRAALEALLQTVPAAHVVAIARRPHALADLGERGVEIRRADYDDRDSLRTALTGIERLLFISGSEIGQRITQHGNVIAAAQAAGVQFVAYTSVLHADTSTLLLAHEHRATEQALAASGLTHALLRNGWYFENYLGQLPTYLEHGIAGSAGVGRISGAARADYAAAAAAVVAGAGHDGAVYELGGDAFSLTDLAATVTAVTGRAVGYTDLPEDEFRNLLIRAGMPAQAATVLADADPGDRRG